MLLITFLDLEKTIIFINVTYFLVTKIYLSSMNSKRQRICWHHCNLHIKEYLLTDGCSYESTLDIATTFVVYIFVRSGCIDGRFSRIAPLPLGWGIQTRPSKCPNWRRAINARRGNNVVEGEWCRAYWDIMFLTQWHSCKIGCLLILQQMRRSSSEEPLLQNDQSAITVHMNAPPRSPDWTSFGF